ncbi:aldehyde dehydrogenase family protein [Palleronia sediminis]|uniref:Aldehyde dehydrogenase n=1 Tax=Palleronia sediminis TaxID=2547833 RepID=A0A4R6A9H7_9RHOB|nr:aldehyde dehydrogenase family protein [Palleronia sediminis]TDL77703.1 aldehyde dehydrogenase family protein [Palleronia sediminis]
MTGPDAIRAAHARLGAAFSLDALPDVAQRRTRLKELSEAMGRARDDLLAAVDSDFGPRAEVETLTAELAFTRAAIADLRRHLRRWARPRRRWRVTPLPGRSDLWREPKGVVGILSPWNYPVQLALVPFATAIAAGNKVILKPSERAPATAEALTRLIGAVFPEDEAACITGDADTAQALSSLPLGHLFFTGSTETGRKVAQAAAATLTPVTLELGGRSPAVALPGADPARHAPVIGWGKWLSAGQTCIAPNHLWVPADRRDAWAEALLAQAAAFRPGDYTAMIDDRAAERMRALLDEAETGGARLLRNGAAKGPGIAPVLVLDPPKDCALLREEIFGPILPILTYRDPQEVIAAEAGGSPLAAYAFDRDASRARAFLRRLRSGGGAVNATILHVAMHDLPFGGIGESGIGAYHGERGFLAFSHERAVFTAFQGPWLRLLSPPYPDMARRLFRRQAR